MSNRLDKEREKKLTPERMKFAVDKLTKLGYEVEVINDNEIKFVFKGKWITFYPYSGWHTGKTITDGRGIENLLKQLKNG